MKTKDRLFLINLASAASLSMLALREFRSDVHMWLYHPNVGYLPQEVVDKALKDLAAADLENWLSPSAKQTLRKIVSGEQHEH